MWPKIIAISSSTHTVEITLDNGVVIAVCSDPGYIHLNLCGIEVPTRVENVNNEGSASNYVNWHYETNK